MRKKRRNYQLTGLILLLCGWVLPALAAEREAIITGYAYERGTATLLYTENHKLRLNNEVILDHKTEYKDAAGNVICTKWMDYSEHRFAPAFELLDLRDGYLEGARYVDGAYSMYSRKKAAAPMETDEAKITPTFVADSGFDLYVRDRMPELLQGKTQKFDMAVPSEQTVLRFEAVVMKRTSLFGRQAIHIKVQPATLLRLLVDPIYLTYDTETGELLRYEGLTNIRNKTGNRHDARIDFPPEQQQYAVVGRR